MKTERKALMLIFIVLLCVMGCERSTQESALGSLNVLQKISEQHKEQARNLIHLYDSYMANGGYDLRNKRVYELDDICRETELRLRLNGASGLPDSYRSELDQKLNLMEAVASTDTLFPPFYEYRFSKRYYGKDELSLVFRQGALLEYYRLKTTKQLLEKLDEQSSYAVFQIPTPYTDTILFHVVTYRDSPIQPAFSLDKGRFSFLERGITEIKVPVSEIKKDSVKLTIKTPKLSGGIREVDVYLRQDQLFKRGSVPAFKQ